MNKIEKLFRKISKYDRDTLILVLEKIMKCDVGELDMIKIKGTDMYRVRSGNYIIIFHYEKNETVIDSIQLRNEKTYK